MTKRPSRLVLFLFRGGSSSELTSAAHTRPGQIVKQLRKILELLGYIFEDCFRGVSATDRPRTSVATDRSGTAATEGALIFCAFHRHVSLRLFDVESS